MRLKLLFLFLLIVCFSCKRHEETSGHKDRSEIKTDTIFNKEKWNVKVGKKYPYRNKMLLDVVYNDTVRSLNKDQILSLFAEPDRIAENHFYYLIDQKNLGLWTLNTKFMVIKFEDEETVEWIKIHE